MTKAQEFELLHKWIAESPADSYMVGTLRHIAIQFENDTRSDFACLPDLPAIERQILDADAFLKARQVAIDTAEARVLELETKAKNAQRMIDSIKASARDLADKLSRI